MGIPSGILEYTRRTNAGLMYICTPLIIATLPTSASHMERGVRSTSEVGSAIVRICLGVFCGCKAQCGSNQEEIRLVVSMGQCHTFDSAEGIRVMWLSRTKVDKLICRFARILRPK